VRGWLEGALSLFWIEAVEKQLDGRKRAIRIKMKKNDLVKFLGIGLVVAIIATGVFYGLIVNKLSSSTGSGKTLVVAARALKAGTVLKAVDLKTIPWPAEQLPKGTFAAIQDVSGSTVFDAISEDEPVLESQLSSIPSGSNGAGQHDAGPAAGVPAGMRAVSVHVTDSTGVMALLRAGHHVDVQVVARHEPGPTEVRTALQNLEVFSVNPQVEQSSQGQSLPVVTLLAKPNEADVLAAADSGARVRLTLRNPLDTETHGRSMLSVDAVMHGPAVAAVAEVHP
jgi:Flp pilus assembly protein CpaB